MKCLNKHPANRYLSAAALSEDLGRFLDHRPIAARRTSIVEKCIRIVSRHPQVTALAAAMVLVCFGSAGIFVWQQWKMDHNTRQRDAYEARQRARASEAESAFESSLIKARELVIRWTQFGLKLDNEPGTDHLQRLDKGVATDLDALRIDLHATQIRVGDTDSQKAVLLAKENFLAELALCLDDLGNLMQRK